MKMSPQPTLFESVNPGVTVETIVLFALGDFLARGHQLSGRWLPFDRLRGAFNRASDKLGYDQVRVEEILTQLKQLGAEVIEMPDFMAKWPYRIRVSDQIADRAAKVFTEISNRNEK